MWVTRAVPALRMRLASWAWWISASDGAGGSFGRMLRSRSRATTNAGQTAKMAGSVRRISHLCLAAAANSASSGSDAGNLRTALECGGQGGGNAVDVAHGQRDLDVPALVEGGDGLAECLERFAPEFIDAFVAAAVANHVAKLQRLEQIVAAFLHQGVVGFDLDAVCLEFHELGEDGGGAVEHRAGEHGAVDALAVGVCLRFVGGPRLGEANAGDVDAVFDMIEQPPRQGLDQCLFCFKALRRRLVILDPVAVEMDADASI